MQSATIIFMDVVGFSRLASTEQQRVVENLNEKVKETLGPLFDNSNGERVIAIPTGDGMALGLLDCDAAGKSTRDWVLSLLMELQQFACKSRHNDEGSLELRIGVHTGPVIVVNDINGKPNLCGHAINMAQRVMDASNTCGVLWSKEAIEWLFGHEIRAKFPFACHFGDEYQITVKHGQTLLVRQLFLDADASYWDKSELKSRWKDTYIFSSKEWDNVSHLEAQWKKARMVAMIHLNGGVFRRERLRQAGNPRKISELAGIPVEDEVNQPHEPFGNQLKRLLVFVPIKSQYEAWWRQTSDASLDPEPYEKCIQFWKMYLLKLAEDRARLLKEKSVNCDSLEVFFYSYETLGCIAYYFDWEGQGGYIRGCPHVWGVELKDSSNFVVEWKSRHIPRAFEEYVRGLDCLQSDSNLLFRVRVNLRGEVVTLVGDDPTLKDSNV